jgi:DNA-binding MarR family transcriptional regulator
MLAPLDLTPADAGILRLLRHSAGISQQSLAQTLGMHAGRLVAVIDALEERGLVVREANAKDRRLYSLPLTEAGEEMLRSIGQVARAHNELMCSGLEAEECAELGRLLRRIAARQELAPGVHPGTRARLRVGRHVPGRAAESRFREAAGLICDCSRIHWRHAKATSPGFIRNAGVARSISFAWA